MKYIPDWLFRLLLKHGAIGLRCLKCGAELNAQDWTGLEWKANAHECEFMPKGGE